MINIEQEETTAKELREEISTRQNKIDGLKRMLQNVENGILEEKGKELVQNFKLSHDHIKLLKKMVFTYYENGGDYISIGVQGKRPFGNSDVIGDIIRIIGEPIIDDEYITDAQQEKAVNNMEGKGRLYFC